MYNILTKPSITKLLVFTGAQVSGASSSTCPSQLAPIHQTSNICTKLINAQVGCVTNVDSYSFYACTYVASVGDISKILCYPQNYRSLKKKQLLFLLHHGFTKFQPILRMCAYVTGKLPVYTMCSQFKRYVGLVNLPHSSVAPCSPRCPTIR